ncbi:MAG: hypothetical protein HOV68_32190, partial [Streptomycetaceae bacterium]|nr:hypothetical protein [Streptomycetaceae bacterium]
ERLARPLSGVPAGLHALMPVESAEEERHLVETGRYAGVMLHGLHTFGYWHEPSDARAAALVLGYATPPRHAWGRSLDALVSLLDVADEGA